MGRICRLAEDAKDNQVNVALTDGAADSGRESDTRRSLRKSLLPSAEASNIRAAPLLIDIDSLNRKLGHEHPSHSGGGGGGAGLHRAPEPFITCHCGFVHPRVATLMSGG